MNRNTQTYQCVGGFGLARMAMELADERAPNCTCYSVKIKEPAPREKAFISPDFYCVSVEYYRIIDRIARGEKP